MTLSSIDSGAEQSRHNYIDKHQPLSQIIENEIRAVGAEGEVVPMDVLRAFNAGFDTSISQGVGMTLDTTIEDVLERTMPLEKRATDIDGANVVAQRVEDRIRQIVEELKGKSKTN